MPENTPNLDLYLKNPVTDGTDTFNIETMLNENFRKIDENTARVGLDGKLDPTQRAAPAIVTVDGDLDTYKTPGSYYVPALTPNAGTSNNSFYMQVIAEGALVLQILYGRVNPNLMFMRRFNGTWGEWDNYSKGVANGIALQDDVTTHLADYTNPHQVTASQVGAVSKNGDTMDGALIFSTTQGIIRRDTDDGSVFINGGNGISLLNGSYIQIKGVGNVGDISLGSPIGKFNFGSTVVGLSLLIGTNSPEGVVTANAGSLYLRGNGGTSTTLYVKESGTGNTGWVAK